MNITSIFPEDGISNYGSVDYGSINYYGNERSWTEPSMIVIIIEILGITTIGTLAILGCIYFITSWIPGWICRTYSQCREMGQVEQV